jgi:hypothetical protein
MVVASATPSNPILDMRVYVDGLAVFMTFLDSMNARIWMDPGAHTLEITATDKTGAVSATVLQVNVVPPQATAVTDIQALPGWQSCSALYPPGSPRAGQICAAGHADAVSSMIPGQSTPSLDGKATKFTMGGPIGYTNELYFLSLGGGTNLTHFIYDVWFLVDNPDAPEALEFDVNQTFGGLRWTWGTECAFKDSHKWDVWDPLNEKWVPTAVPCNPFPANTWIHLVWNFERVNGQVHYISVSVNGVTSPVDAFFAPQQKWTLEDINIAFQMDGDFRQDPYNVWLDEMTLQTF